MLKNRRKKTTESKNNAINIYFDFKNKARKE